MTEERLRELAKEHSNWVKRGLGHVSAGQLKDSITILELLGEVEKLRDRIDKLRKAAKEAIDVEFMWTRSSEILDEALNKDEELLAQTKESCK